MTDLVKELRSNNADRMRKACRPAADEIERLRAELLAAQRAIQWLSPTVAESEDGLPKTPFSEHRAAVIAARKATEDMLAAFQDDLPDWLDEPYDDKHLIRLATAAIRAEKDTDQ